MENNIEEDIKLLEEFSNENVLYGSTVGMTLKKYKDLQLSTEHILSDYKRVLKENEQKNKMIDLMAEYIYDSQIECDRYFRDKEEVKAIFLLECIESEE